MQSWSINTDCRSGVSKTLVTYREHWEGRMILGDGDVLIYRFIFKNKSSGVHYKIPRFSLNPGRVFHSFLFLPLVAEPDPDHVLFQVQLFGDRCDLF